MKTQDCTLRKLTATQSRRRRSFCGGQDMPDEILAYLVSSAAGFDGRA